MVKKKTRSSGKKDLTLRDVVVHMEHMEQRLTAGIKGLDTRVSGLDTKVSSLEDKVMKLDRKVTNLEIVLTERIDALEEDLTATIHDTIKIRTHVGMAVPDDV